MQRHSPYGREYVKQISQQFTQHHPSGCRQYFGYPPGLTMLARESIQTMRFPHNTMKQQSLLQTALLQTDNPH